MVPEYLLLEDFLGHRFSEIDCTLFDSVLIVGKNKNNPLESNATGKTSIFYAIDFALFGVVPSDTIDEIVRDGCEECRVTFDFVIKNEKYRILRKRRKKAKKSYIELKKWNGEDWDDISQKTITETNAELARIIQINYDAFRNSVLFSQLNLDGLASNTTGERRGTLREAMGLTNYEQFMDSAKKEAKQIKIKIAEIDAVIGNLGSPTKDIKEFQDTIEESKKIIKEGNKKRKDIEKQIKLKEKTLNNLEQKINNDSVAELDTVKTDIKNVKSKLESLVETYDKTKREHAGLDKKNKSNNSKINKLKKEKEKIKVDKDIDDLKSQLDKMIQNEINGKSLVNSLKIKLKDLNTPLPDGDICPHCHQEMSREHKENCAKRIKKESAELKKEISFNENKLEKVADKKHNIEADINTINDDNINLQNIINQIEKIENELKNDIKYLEQLQELISKNKEWIDYNNDKLKELEEKRNKCSSDISIQDIKLDISNIKKEINTQNFYSEELLKEISSKNTLVGIYTEKIDIRKKDKVLLEQKKKDLKTLKADFDTYKVVIRGFSSRGIPTMIIYTILDDLQLEVNKFLAELKPGLELQFVILKDKKDGNTEDTLDIKFIEHGKTRSYKLLSGGQKFLFAVALKLGLSVIIQKRLGVDIKFLELDEVDASLDKACTETYANVIKTLQKDFKVFVITHNDALKDKFNKAILVEGDEKNGAVSKLVDSW